MNRPNITEGEWEVKDTVFGKMVCLKDRSIAVASASEALIGWEECLCNLQAISAVPNLIKEGINLLDKIESFDECSAFADEEIEAFKQALKKAGCEL